MSTKIVGGTGRDSLCKNYLRNGTVKFNGGEFHGGMERYYYYSTTDFDFATGRDGTVKYDVFFFHDGMGQ